MVSIGSRHEPIGKSFRGNKTIIAFAIFSILLFAGCVRNVTVSQDLELTKFPQYIFVSIHKPTCESVLASEKCNPSVVADISRFESLLKASLITELKNRQFTLAESKEEADLTLDVQLVRFNPVYWVVQSYIKDPKGEVISKSYAGLGEWIVEVNYLNRSGTTIGTIQVNPETAKNLRVNEAASDIAKQVSAYTFKKAR